MDVLFCNLYRYLTDQLSNKLTYSIHGQFVLHYCFCAWAGDVKRTGLEWSSYGILLSV